MSPYLEEHDLCLKLSHGVTDTTSPKPRPKPNNKGSTSAKGNSGSASVDSPLKVYVSGVSTVVGKVSRNFTLSSPSLVP